MNSEDTFIRKTNYNITDLVSISILYITSISFIVKKVWLLHQLSWKLKWVFLTSVCPFHNKTVYQIYTNISWRICLFVLFSFCCFVLFCIVLFCVLFCLFCLICFVLFVCLFVTTCPTRDYSLIWRCHYYRLRSAKFDLFLALMAIEHWGFFSVPHLLRHGASDNL